MKFFKNQNKILKYLLLEIWKPTYTKWRHFCEWNFRKYFKINIVFYFSILKFINRKLIFTNDALKVHLQFQKLLCFSQKFNLVREYILSNIFYWYESGRAIQPLTFFFDRGIIFWKSNKNICFDTTSKK